MEQLLVKIISFHLENMQQTGYKFINFFLQKLFGSTMNIFSLSITLIDIDFLRIILYEYIIVVKIIIEQ